MIVEDLHPHYVYSLVISAVTIAPGPYSQVYTVQMPEDGKYMIITLLGMRNNIHKGITTLDAFSEVRSPISCKE